MEAWGGRDRQTGTQGAFEKAAHSYADQKVRIALAHNQEDLAETMLHNLCRGTGLRGLCTMRPTAEKIIRPILCLNRREIADFLKKYQIPHIQDSTNLCDEYTRNRIRHHILRVWSRGSIQKQLSIWQKPRSGFRRQRLPDCPGDRAGREIL